jgi:hypothetical protein
MLGIRRREFIILLGTSATARSALWPARTYAQSSGRPRRIGFVVGSAVNTGAPLLAALREGLLPLGWVEGRNVEIAAHFGADDPEKIEETMLQRGILIATGRGGCSAQGLGCVKTLALIRRVEYLSATAHPES